MDLNLLLKLHLKAAFLCLHLSLIQEPSIQSEDVHSSPKVKDQDSDPDQVRSQKKEVQNSCSTGGNPRISKTGINPQAKIWCWG